MDPDDERDYIEEAYWRDYCQACGDSPCTWDGRPDGFHDDNWDGITPDTIRELRES